MKNIQFKKTRENKMSTVELSEKKKKKKIQLNFKVEFETENPETKSLRTM